MPKSTFGMKAYYELYLLDGQGYFPLPTSPGRSVVVTEQFVQLDEHQRDADEELHRFVFAHGNHLRVLP